MITRIHHVGIVVRELPAACRFWRDTLGLPLVREAELPDQGVRAALLACGPCEIELLEATDPSGGVGRFLERRGEALHHLCLESDDVGREVGRLAAMGVELIDPGPRRGLAGLIAFVHPRACSGVLMELATPLDHAPLPPAPITVTAVQAVVEDVHAAAGRYGDLFGLTLGIHRPDWSLAQLSVGGVTVHLSAAGPDRKPGLSALRLATVDVDALAGRFDEDGVAYRRGGFGLALSSSATRGAPLIVHPGHSPQQPSQLRRQEDRA